MMTLYAPGRLAEPDVNPCGPESAFPWKRAPQMRGTLGR
jgi:hypothetical protein